MKQKKKKAENVNVSKKKKKTFNTGRDEMSAKVEEIEAKKKRSLVHTADNWNKIGTAINSNAGGRRIRRKKKELSTHAQTHLRYMYM